MIIHQQHRSITASTHALTFLQRELSVTRKWNHDPLAFTDDDEANPVIEPGTRRQDCGQITDGACGVVLASARFAQEHARRHGHGLERLDRIAGWGHRNAGLRLKDKIERSAGAPMRFRIARGDRGRLAPRRRPGHRGHERHRDP